MSKTGKLTINGKDAWSTWGMSMDSKGLSALMTPAGMKDNVKNSSRNLNGERVIRGNAKKKARNVSLIVQFSAKSQTEFLTRYMSFCQELETGFLNISTSFQPGVVYRMEYRDCMQFMEYGGLGLAKFTLKLVENDPSDRSTQAL